MGGRGIDRFGKRPSFETPVRSSAAGGSRKLWMLSPGGARKFGDLDSAIEMAPGLVARYPKSLCGGCSDSRGVDIPDPRLLLSADST